MGTFFRRLAVMSLMNAINLSTAAAAPGDLDPSFGVGGLVTLDIPEFTYPGDVNETPDGKILLSARYITDSQGNGGSALLRLLSDGRIDPSFHGGTLARSGIKNGSDLPVSTAVLDDGGAVMLLDVAALSSSGLSDALALVRFTADGEIDRSFGRQGKAVVSFPSDGYQALARPSVILAQPDGQFLVGATVPTADLSNATTLLRFTADGKLDTSFGKRGISSVNAFGAPTALALLSNGDILARNARGELEFTTKGQVTALTSTTNGATVVRTARAPASDSFNPQGRSVSAMTVQGDFGDEDTDASAVAHTERGAPDLGFVVNKFDYARVGLADNAQEALYQEDGRVLITGLGHTDGGTYAFGVARLDINGALDPSFAGDGKEILDFGLAEGESALTYASTLQADGRLLLAGMLVIDGRPYYGIARVLTQ
jgi:uncharacterized delta-60 repeat protein